MPIPYCLPPDLYSASDKPWNVTEAHPGMDSLGMKLEVAQEGMGKGRVMRTPS